MSKQQLRVWGKYCLVVMHFKRALVSQQQEGYGWTSQLFLCLSGCLVIVGYVKLCFEDTMKCLDYVEALCKHKECRSRRFLSPMF